MRASVARALCSWSPTGRASPGGPCWCATMGATGPRSWVGLGACQAGRARCALRAPLKPRFSVEVSPIMTCSSWRSIFPVSDSACCFFFADVFLHGDWCLESSGFDNHDPEIASLSAELHARAAQSRAPSTFSSYAGPWAKFKNWCSEKGVSALLASPFTVDLYLTKILRTAQSPSPVLSCFGAIFLNHSLAGLSSPTHHPMVAMAWEIARHTKVAGRNVRKPFLASHIRRLFSLWLFAPQSTLADIMRLSTICLSFFAFLRYSVLVTIQWQEIQFLLTHIELFLEKSKTDQYREPGSLDFNGRPCRWAVLPDRARRAPPPVGSLRSVRSWPFASEYDRFSLSAAPA
jgi:hypothetical protein